jgi:transcriptional regulator of met regulon
MDSWPLLPRGHLAPVNPISSLIVASNYAATMEIPLRICKILRTRRVRPSVQTGSHRMNSTSLIPQCLDRLQSSSAAGRIDAEKQAHRNGHAQSHDHACRRNQGTGASQ